MTRPQFFAIFAVAIWLAGPTSHAFPGDKDDASLLVKDTEKISERFMDGATTLEDWQRRLPRLKREYLEMLGLWPLPEKTPLDADITGTVDRGDVQIDLVHFQSRPGRYVTGNLYRPTTPNKQR